MTSLTRVRGSLVVAVALSETTVLYCVALSVEDHGYKGEEKRR
jgi:hypothetical protein